MRTAQEEVERKAEIDKKINLAQVELAKCRFTIENKIKGEIREAQRYKKVLKERIRSLQYSKLNGGIF